MLKNLLSTITDDYEAAFKVRQSFAKILYRAWENPNFRAVFRYRLSVYFFKKGWGGKLVAQHLFRIGTFKNACCLSTRAEIAPGLILPHAIGVIIARNVKIGENTTIYQHVTIGTGNNNGEITPAQIGRNVVIYTGACLIGDIQVGDGAVIGANSVVNKNVAPYTMVAGVPAKVIKNLTPQE